MSNIAIGYNSPWDEHLERKYRFEDADTRIRREETPEDCPICHAEILIENDHCECCKCPYWVDYKD